MGPAGGEEVLPTSLFPTHFWKLFFAFHVTRVRFSSLSLLTCKQRLSLNFGLYVGKVDVRIEIRRENNQLCYKCVFCFQSLFIEMSLFQKPSYSVTFLYTCLCQFFSCKPLLEKSVHSSHYNKNSKTLFWLKKHDVYLSHDITSI